MLMLLPLVILVLPWLSAGSPVQAPIVVDVRPLAEEARSLFREVVRRHRLPFRRCELEATWLLAVPQTEAVMERHLGRAVDTRAHRAPEGVTVSQVIEAPAEALCDDAAVMAAAANPRPVAQGIWTSGPAMGRPILQRMAFSLPIFSADRRRAVVPVLESSYSWWVAPGSGTDSGPEWQPRLFVSHADLYERQGGRWIFLRREEVLHMTYVPDERRR
jgi:hypothetical protein